MKKTITLVALTAIFLSACGGPKIQPTNQSYEVLGPDGTEDTRIEVLINSVLDENLYFTVKYDSTMWEIKETPGLYQTNLIFDNLKNDDETCYILPGTIGRELEKDYQIEQWSYKSDLTYGIDYQFINPITKITEMWIFEAESNGAGFPTTLFELHMPADGQDQGACYDDYVQLIGTYKFHHYTGTPEDLEAIMQEIERTKALNAEIEKQKEIERLKSLGEETQASGSGSSI